jgi:hypothetical protein
VTTSALISTLYDPCLLLSALSLQIKTLKLT